VLIWLRIAVKNGCLRFIQLTWNQFTAHNFIVNSTVLRLLHRHMKKWLHGKNFIRRATAKLLKINICLLVMSKQWFLKICNVPYLEGNLQVYYMWNWPYEYVRKGTIKTKIKQKPTRTTTTYNKRSWNDFSNDHPDQFQTKKNAEQQLCLCTYIGFKLHVCTYIHTYIQTCACTVDLIFKFCLICPVIYINRYFME
jgi:hypothetical protein